RLWFATIAGVAVVDPAHLPANTVPPPVGIEEVVIDGRRLPVGGPLVVPPGTQKLDLHYTATSLRNPARVRFKYRLEGFDRDWVDAGTERTAHYTSLAPG